MHPFHDRARAYACTCPEPPGAVAMKQRMSAHGRAGPGPTANAAPNEGLHQQRAEQTGATGAGPPNVPRDTRAHPQYAPPPSLHRADRAANDTAGPCVALDGTRQFRRKGGRLKVASHSASSAPQAAHPMLHAALGVGIPIALLSLQGTGGEGATATGPDATHPPISVKPWRGAGSWHKASVSG
eukprot:CAMPEP_0174370334 /NCGR_PEP_ID=MMETSP0811_2-20130205/95758_1 /TAXON_ID=73025 ORGANISM="Eutreptiella gymnastica-like, Strain CCMP1594" /NCGR_SAMPLE_ID=MMETSP0811_2 /ASSEMBLY_ACC=CAM_ASM_000667 /LENGTH=183 /DNA_ID=CAMNT_0015515643 /DNA_START=247 /DNA_END=796 /DNA_ORIENTATION=+